MDKKYDSIEVVVCVLITDTKGHAASKGDTVSEHYIAQSKGKKSIKRHFSARAFLDITEDPFLQGFAVTAGEMGCSWRKGRTSRTRL